MRKLLDYWATVIRNTRAIGAAVVVWLMVALMWGLKCQADRDPVVASGQERATVIEVLGGDPGGDSESGLKLRQAVVMLADSTFIQIILSPPLPEVGDGIPLRCEKYRSGKRAYTFDAREWALTGPR